jgi:diguanylate cyclase (GGDEF)-like protein/PAS domain S-box-containing protein
MSPPSLDAAGPLLALFELFEAHEAVMLLIDPASGMVVAGNARARSFYGYAREQLRGLPLTAIQDDTPGCPAARRLHRLADGSCRWVELRASPLRQGEASLLCAIVTDLSPTGGDDAALLAAKERLQIAIECARLTVWDAEVESGEVYLSEGWARMRGEEPRPVRMAAAAYMELVHPEDRDEVNRVAWETVKGDRNYYDQEYRLQTVDGRWIWLLSRGRVSERGTDGRAKRMSGTLMDVTARKQAEERLMVSEQRFRDVVDAAGEYVWESDPQFRLTYVSDRIEAMLGFKPQEVLGRPPSDFLAPGETSHSQSWYKSHAAPDGTFRGLEQCVISKSGRHVWQRITGIPVRNAQGELTGYRGTAMDVTEAKEARQRLEYLATRDSLTGLPNRALLADRTAQAIAQAQRSGEQAALLFIDLDNFKQVNDSLGHHAGDQLLKQVAARLTEAVRRADTISRQGGDEFVILLSSLKDTGPVAAIAAKVCAELARPFEGLAAGQAAGVHSTGSVGIALFPGDGADFIELMKKADAAMYRAKARGRNTWEFFNPPAIAA